MFSNKKKDYCRQVNIVDEHHPAPTFTPPELPKKVHVRGSASGNYSLQNPYLFSPKQHTHVAVFVGSSNQTVTAVYIPHDQSSKSVLHSFFNVLSFDTFLFGNKSAL